MDSTLADESLPASAPATTTGSPKGATTPECDAGSVTPTAGGEQENQGPDRHSQAEVEETEKVEQMEDEEDKEKTAASVSGRMNVLLFRLIHTQHIKTTACCPWPIFRHTVDRISFYSLQI